jgi:hypothetical protein
MMNHSFRTKMVVRAFAFGCTASLAACAADGSIKAPAQSQLVQACDDASIALTMAGFYADKINAKENEVFEAAKVAYPKFCSPSALAADLTPAALSANIQALGDTVAQLNAIDGATGAK